MSPPPARVLLCIDDRPHLLWLRETLLGKHGYVVVAANSAAAAIAKLDQTTVPQQTNTPSVGLLRDA